MNRWHLLVVLPLVLAASACGDAESPVPVEDRDRPGLVTRAEMGADWPLSVDYGFLSCNKESFGSRVLEVPLFTAPDGTRYALSGLSHDDGVVKRMTPIWRQGASLRPLIDRASALC